MRKEDFYDASSKQTSTPVPGDKVRFLNSVGGGTVTAFHGKDMVLVQDENGFDMPVLISECVVIGSPEHKVIPTLKFTRASNLDVVTPVKTPPNEAVEKEVQKKVPVFIEKTAGERLNITLAFVPTKPKDFINSSFEAYIINESNYWIYFNYMSFSNKSYNSRCHDLLEPDTKLFIEEIQKDNLVELEHLCVQLLAFKQERSYSLKQPATVEIRMDIVKFYKLHCFTENRFFVEDALVVPLVVNDSVVGSMC